ncbi:hypothetical protein DPEC_G00012110 [Dallia pectoralis]|uniref:Uncharacterized protein n=1 Tax=Dallia pectoralis TaxID=75939 RepID=A0ACC2HMG1_DALPE|nr:hypothetical protein DPEC_G00012110 [Dallia pectoralis]
MAASMRTTTGSWTGMALVLILSALFLHAGVHCETETAATTESTSPSTNTSEATAEAVDTTSQVSTASSVNDTGASTTAVPGETGVTEANHNTTDNEATNFSNFTSVLDLTPTNMYYKTTDGPEENQNLDASTYRILIEGNAPLEPEKTAPVSFGNATVKCVDNEATKNMDTIMIRLKSPSTCMNTKRILEESNWCYGCNLQVFQEENSTSLVLTRTNGPVKELVEILNTEPLKGQLGVESASAQSGLIRPSNVFTFMLIAGLLVAAALIVYYCWKNCCGDDAKGMSPQCPVDQENQGNTLVSVAPLNPPEPLGKPANGDSQEASKPQAPPTNGHSAAKTADTEL